MSEAWIVQRANELHHIAMSHAVVQAENYVCHGQIALQRVPLMRTFLEGSSASTIPFPLSQFKDRSFNYGAAGTEGTASSLFEVNVHIWQFGRPHCQWQPRTMSVSERLAAAVARKTAAKVRCPGFPV